VTNRFRPVLTVILALVLGSLSPSLASASTKHPYGVSTRQSEAAALRQVKWTSNVTISVGRGSWTFKSDGLPASRFVATNYAVPANPLNVSATGANVVASATVLQDQNYDYTLPTTPVYSKTVTTANQGPIGFLLDGAALFNPYEANHATVATNDNFIATVNGTSASFLDSCDGHPGPGGQYHYHGLPACLVSYATGGSSTVTSVTSLSAKTTSAVREVNAASRRPVILGFAFDGYGIYDNVAMNGKTVPVSSLDSCNGIFSPVPGYRHGVYHYVLENVKGARSSIGCYHGIVSSAYTQALESLLSGPSAASTRARDSRVTATAFTLAASKSEDSLLLTMLQLNGLAHYC
jgi:YHYH protein